MQQYNTRECLSTYRAWKADVFLAQTLMKCKLTEYENGKYNDHQWHFLALYVGQDHTPFINIVKRLLPVYMPYCFCCRHIYG